MLKEIKGWGFAGLLVVVTGAQAQSAATAADVTVTNLVTIAAGAFTMGRDDGPADERPAHVVLLPAFQIDLLPVTNAQFAGFLNVRGHSSVNGERYYDHDDSDARIHQVAGKYVSDRGFEHHPVVEPSWLGAREYCAWRGERLPTEAEWEKAARGMDGRKYPWGNTAPDRTRAQFGTRFNETAPVQNFAAGASPYVCLLWICALAKCRDAQFGRLYIVLRKKIERRSLQKEEKVARSA